MLSRNNPAVDDGWLCDRGRYTHSSLDAPDRITSALTAVAVDWSRWGGRYVLDHIADRLRATFEKYGAGSVAILASGEQTNEEAHFWARIQSEALAAGRSCCGPEGDAGWDQLAPYAATIADLDDARLIVVAGATDLVHRAPILELRIRRRRAGRARRHRRCRRHPAGDAAGSDACCCSRHHPRRAAGRAV